MADREEGYSKVPKFNGKNYTIWKTRMSVFLQALGEDVYSMIENKYTLPTVNVLATETSEARTKLKPRAKFLDAEKIASQNNFKALNAIF